MKTLITLLTLLFLNNMNAQINISGKIEISDYSEPVWVIINIVGSDSNNATDSVKTDNEGNYEFASKEFGFTYFIKFKKTGYQSKRIKIDATEKPNDNTKKYELKINIKLEPGTNSEPLKLEKTAIYNKKEDNFIWHNKVKTKKRKVRF